MQKWAQGCVAVSVLLSGCAVFEKTPANNNEISQIELRIPAGMAVPNQPAAYDIPPVSAATLSASVGADNRSPTLILATATSSRMEEDEKLARVWFERNDFTGDIKPFIQTQLQQFFSAKNVALTPVDDTGLRYETGWISRSRSSGFWFWESEQQVEQMRYSIVLEPRQHGRSLSMTVSLLEHEYFVPDAQLNAIDIKTHEVNLLNGVINKVSIAEVLVAREQRAQAAEVNLGLGVDLQGNPALISSQSADITWSQLELLFEELHLTVTDFDRSAFTYFVNYQKPERGFWRTITFRDAPVSLPLVDGDYQIVLSRLSNNKTAILWLNKEGQPLSAAEVNAIYEPIVAAIRATGAEL
ncbi:outer membrane protein assembly factor BamC [Alishewanella sp. d11]|uniref:outer membrane protein assembly factor BamC n=1 Tax=Alishewanella sp. d11 TaxID=3414030 RepID=UPI003BF795D2